MFCREKGYEGRSALLKLCFVIRVYTLTIRVENTHIAHKRSSGDYLF